MKTTIHRTISPNKLITSSKCKNIKVTNNKYIIEEFEIYSNDVTNQIEKIIITKGEHPNCDPTTKIFCIPTCLKGDVLEDSTIEKIVNMIKIFNFESSYERPWYVFDYEK
jgi:hypothetical protein